MLLIPPYLFDAVVALEQEDAPVEVGDASSFRAVGSGVIVGRLVTPAEDPEDEEYLLYLVTNAHVVENQQSLWAKINCSGKAERFELALRDQDGNDFWTQ